MILLLDSHAVIWWLDGSPMLSAAARSAIRDPGNDVLVSAASVWELAIKAANGKLRIDDDLGEAVRAAGFVGVPITLEDALTAGALPQHHRDPFDRMLVAQAQRLDALVVTRDRAFRPYEVNVLPA